MTEHDISFGQCFSKGWEAFKPQAGLAIGASLLYMVAGTAASQIPLGGILAVIPLIGGLYMTYLGIVKRLNPDIPTLFAGFSSVDNWARWLGVGCLLCAYELLLLLVCAIPGAIPIGFGIAALVAGPFVWEGVLLIAAGCLVTLAIYYAIAVRWIFVFLAGAEGATAFDAIRISTELTEGLRFRIFWIMVAMGLINTAGYLLCCIGIFFTLPVTSCALCALYLDVKQLKAQRPGAERPAG